VPVTPSERQRLHPLTPFFTLIVGARQWAAPMVLAIFAGRDSSRRELLFAAPVVLGTLAGFLQWWRFTYAFDGQRLVIDEGVFTRKRRVVPLDRIQQVEMHSKLRHRLFGVTVLKVDTAGGGGEAEADLAVVSVAEATRLRSILLPDDAHQPASTSELSATSGGQLRSERTGETLVRLDPWSLAIGGMTGSELAIMLTIVFWVFQLLDDLPDSIVSDLDDHLIAPSSVAGFAAAALAVLVFWFGLAAVAGIVKNFGFEMRRSGDDLRVRRGMFERTEGSMPLRRVQAVRVEQGVMRRAIGYAEVVVQSAGGAGGVARIDVPILARRDLEPLVRSLVVVPDAWTPDRLTAHPPAARRRAIVRRVVIVAVLAAGPVVVAPSRAVPLAVVALALAAAAGELAYRGLGHSWEGGIVTARAGGIARDTVVVPSAKVQSTRLESTPFQRRAGLATLHLDVAGRGRTPSIRDADAASLRALQAALLSDPASRSDEVDVRRRASSSSPS
jgi:putative membrane protein